MNQLPLILDSKHTALTFVMAKQDVFRDDFPQWLRANWSIWEAFEREANRIWARGRAHYSARTIGEFLRHETALRSNDAEYKINDHYWPDMARLYVMFYPARDGFFEFRRSDKSEVRAA